jgi:DNA-binding transcriptional LysR family regulator
MVRGGVIVNLAGVDLNLLVAFDALMAECSVTRAAARLSVGQSAMSATLGRLRRLFDDPLLVRQGRVLVPTPVAVSLVDPVHDVLTTIRREVLPTRSGFDPAVDQRVFTVMTSDYVALVFLRPLLAQLVREAPSVRLHVRPVAADLGEQVRRGLVDLLIVPREILGDTAGLQLGPLFSDRYVCAVDRDNPDVGDSLTVEEFSNQPYLAYDVGGLGSLVERQLDAAGIRRNLEVSTGTFLVAPYLVRGTRLLTLLHERLVSAMPGDLALRLVEPPMPLDPVTEVMAWTTRHEHDPAHVWLRERLLDLAARS